MKVENIVFVHTGLAIIVKYLSLSDVTVGVFDKMKHTSVEITQTVVVLPLPGFHQFHALSWLHSCQAAAIDRWTDSHTYTFNSSHKMYPFYVE